MPASLRRACHACTLAKRRCQPQLPKCSRCLKNGIACNYDLEPLTHISSTPSRPLSETEPQQNRQAPSDVTSHHSYSTFVSVAAAQQAAIETFNAGLTPPELRMVADEEVVQWGLSQLVQIPYVILQNRPPPFVHTQLYRDRETATARLRRTLSLHQTLSTGHVSETEIIPPSRNVGLQRLIKSDAKDLSLTDLLLLIDELSLYLIIYLFNDVSPSYKAEAEPHLDLLTDWTKHLWSTIPDQPSNNLSPWQAWLVAESARRSMIAPYLLRGAFSALKHGYAVFQPFLESMPFDPRTELWEAMSEAAWQSAVTMHGGEPTVLISFREFIESSADISRALQGQGLFQRMLLVSFYGKAALAALS